MIPSETYRNLLRTSQLFKSEKISPKLVSIYTAGLKSKTFTTKRSTIETIDIQVLIVSLTDYHKHFQQKFMFGEAV